MVVSVWMDFGECRVYIWKVLTVDGLVWIQPDCGDQDISFGLGDGVV
jgi:hypothetical protein